MDFEPTPPIHPGLEFKKNDLIEAHCRTLWGANKNYHVELHLGQEYESKKTHYFTIKYEAPVNPMRTKPLLIRCSGKTTVTETTDQRS
jgi:hypothetical protein